MQAQQEQRFEEYVTGFVVESAETMTQVHRQLIGLIAVLLVGVGSNSPR